MLLIFGVGCSPRKSDPFTRKTERDRFVKEKTQFVDSVFLNLPDTTNEKMFSGAFWASELMLRKSEKAIPILKYALNHFSLYSKGFRRSLLQHIYTLYPESFNVEIDSLLVSEQNEKFFTMMASYQIRGSNRTQEKYLLMMKERFPEWQNNPILSGFIIENSGQKGFSKLMIDDLISFRKTKSEACVFVMVSKNRDLPGVAIILNRDGDFLKENGDTLKIRMLARSITNLPGYLTNGNTPQGVLSMQYIGASDNVFIGKSPTVITTLPFESSPAEFSFGKIDSANWTMDIYNGFFPESWKNYQARNMAFYAGKAGRSEIIMHGTTIDTRFYKNQPYFPFTPSLGCLCALERWSETDGSLIESEQLRLIEALRRNKIDKALVYVVEN